MNPFLPWGDYFDIAKGVFAKSLDSANEAYEREISIERQLRDELRKDIALFEVYGDMSPWEEK